MPYIESFDGCRLAVSTEGREDAPAILLSHYLGGSKGTWKNQIEALREDFRLVSFDTRGQGESEVRPGPYHVEVLARDALAVMETLGLDQVDFIGASQGAMGGMWLAIHHPERIRRLVLANTTPFIPNKDIWDQLAARARAEGMAQIADSTIRSWLCEAFKSAHPQATQGLVDIMASLDVEGYAANTAVLRDVDLRSGLAAISCPVLVIGGTEDGPRGASAPVMAASVKQGRLVMIEQAAHLSHLENPAAFNAALKEFLQ